MAILAKNVVRLADSGRDPALRIIDECRDRLDEALGKWLQGIGGEVAEELFVLAEGTRDRLKQTQYLDLRRQVETEWGDLAKACHRALQEEKPSSDIALNLPDFDGLQLVDDAELSEGIVLRELSARMAETCDDELYGLDRRMALLLGESDADHVEHPLRTEVVCQAISSACSILTSNPEHRSLLLRRIERHLHQALPAIYREVNAYLITLGLLPELKRTYRRGGSVPAAQNVAITGGQFDAASAAVMVSAAQAMTTSQGSAFLPALGAPSNGDFLAVLQRLAMARSPSPGEAQANLAGVAHAFEASANENGAEPWGDIQLPGATASSNDVSQAAALSQAFFASLEQFRHHEGAGATNQIHQIRQSEAARQVGHVEAVTIDIVAMLFDFIFEDQHLPDGVKSLVGRLQIPVLKLAMQDSGFFANRHHPARRFLDEISGIALRWGGAVDTEDPFYCILGELISQIQDGFESDVEIFTRALEELQAFVDRQNAVEDESAMPAAELAIERERESQAWERAQFAVAEISATEMPELLHDFLHEQWLLVLQKTALEHEAGSSAWHEAVGLIGDLAESIVPRRTNDERLLLIRSLPDLLGRINRGLDLVSTDKGERRPFFDALVDLHTAALKGELPDPAPLTPAPVADLLPENPCYDSDSPAGDLIVTRSLENGVEVEEISLVGAKPVWRADDLDASRRVALLKRGDWIEFRQEEGPAIRERLTWTSPRGRILVFSNHRAAKAISIAPEALAHLIRTEKAAIVEEESLFERAMTGVLENIGGN